jgi:hypothetical protein
MPRALPFWFSAPLTSACSATTPMLPTEHVRSRTIWLAWLART